MIGKKKNSSMDKLLLSFLAILFHAHIGDGDFFSDLLKASSTNNNPGQTLPNTGSDLEGLLFRSCYVCHGTSISTVTSSCWETVDEEHDRFVSVQSCPGACSITVSNQSRIGLVDYTRNCDLDCSDNCHHTDRYTQVCKYCCYGDRCNSILPTYTVEGPERIHKASVKNLKTWLGGVMANPRHHSINPPNKIAARKRIISTWRDFGIHPVMQQFTIAKRVLEDKSPHNYRSYIKLVINGYNIIGTVRGRYYGTLRDKIIVLLAHYDTHIGGTPGVDDNASGVSSLLEIARLLMRNETCTRDHSVILVATDFSEEGSYWDGLRGRNYTNCIFGDLYQGLSGSSHFLCGYLLPHVRRTGSHVMTVMNMHSILNYDNGAASQSLPDLQDFITGKFRYSNDFYQKFENQVSKRRYVGDWIMASYVQVEVDLTTTQVYANALAKTWDQIQEVDFKTALIKQHIPLDGNEHIIMQKDDCLPFMRLRHPIPCISLTDTGPLRGYMKRCHHEKCDDVDHVTDVKLRFLAKVTELVWRTLEKLTRGSCPLPIPEGANSDVIVPPQSPQLPVHKRCKKALLKSATKQHNTSLVVTATCRFTRTALHLCVPPQRGLWGLVNTGMAWIPKKAKKRHSKRLWYQVTFGQRTNVTAITLQGVPGKGYLRSFRLSYSEDGLFWTWYIPTNPLPRTSADLGVLTKAKRRKKIYLDPIISTQYIRVNPRKWKRRIAMRVEFHGCNLQQ